MMKKLAKRFMKDEQGLELAEYAVMAALIIAVVVAAIVALRSAIANRFNATANVVNQTS
jgi:Flp pilus assembly pilin Flp